MYDLIIKNGKIVDGSGKPAYKCDIAVKDGKIALIADRIDAEAVEIIDATDLVVSPGFIECHTHSDQSGFTGSSCSNFLEQGCTTQIAGNCGSSPVPYYEGGMRASRQKLSPEEFAFRANIAKTADSFMSHASNQSYGTNTAFLIGHGPIWAKVMGFSNDRPTAQQMKAMQQEVIAAMEAGYLGMSSGLVYAPSVYATTEDLTELSSVMAPYGGIYVSHIRGEADTVIDSVAEAIEIGEKAGVPVHISHIKVMGLHNEGKSIEMLRLIDEANQRGVCVTADQYPYIASSAGLSSQIPPKYLLGGTNAMLERIKDPEMRKKIEWSIFNESHEFTSNFYTAGYDGALISSALKTKEYVNRTVGEIAKTEGKAPFDKLCEILIANDGTAQGIYFNQSPTDLVRFMSHPKVFCGSDNSNYAEQRPDYEKQGGHHPRGIGSAVQRLELIRDLHLRTLEDAVYSMTYAPAQAFGLKQQGLLKEGYDASITVFDYEKLHAQATFEHPCRGNIGIEYVVVNGKIALTHGKPTGVRAGRVLKRA